MADISASHSTKAVPTAPPSAACASGIQVCPLTKRTHAGALRASLARSRSLDGWQLIVPSGNGLVQPSVPVRSKPHPQHESEWLQKRAIMGDVACNTPIQQRRPIDEAPSAGCGGRRLPAENHKQQQCSCTVAALGEGAEAQVEEAVAGTPTRSAAHCIVAAARRKAEACS
jgi:hypothetical protein